MKVKMSIAYKILNYSFIIYKCPYCKSDSYGQEWNKETKEFHSFSIKNIDEAFSEGCEEMFGWKCPECGEFVDGGRIEKLDFGRKKFGGELL